MASWPNKDHEPCKGDDMLRCRPLVMMCGCPTRGYVAGRLELKARNSPSTEKGCVCVCPRPSHHLSPERRAWCARVDVPHSLPQQGGAWVNLAAAGPMSISSSAIDTDFELCVMDDDMCC
jgi:hypothetical protein